MTAADELTALVFRALYAEYDLRTFGILHVVTPKGTPVYAGDSLGQIARQFSDHEDLPRPGRPRPPGRRPATPVVPWPRRRSRHPFPVPAARPPGSGPASPAVVAAALAGLLPGTA